MSFGLQIANAAGTTFFSTLDTTWNYVGSFIAPANGDGSLTNPALEIISEVLIQKSFVDSAPDHQEAYIHTCARSGNTITATGGTVATLVVVLAR